MSDQPILELRGINKSFGPVDVLKDVDFVARAGQVTALVGDNGAGKSTLVKCISGTYPIDSGRVPLRGQAGDGALARATPAPSASRSSTRTSRCATTSTSSRTCSSAVSSSAASVLDESSMEQAAEETLAVPVGAHREVGAAAGRQPVRRPAPDRGDRQGRAVELQGGRARRADRRARRRADRAGARAWYAGWPTAASRVVLISHNMIDVLQVADSIAVLYLGQMAAQVAATEVNQQQLVELITTGRSAATQSRPATSKTAATHDRAPRRARRPTPDVAAVAAHRARPRQRPPGDYIRDYYRQRVRGGDMGSLPAVAGLVVLVILFSAVQPTFGGAVQLRQHAHRGLRPGAAGDGPDLRAAARRDRPVRRVRRRRLRRGDGAADGRLRLPWPSASAPAWSPAWSSGC